MIGQTISHYRVLEKIGAGGMGVVYRARDERLERDVALKVLAPGLTSDKEFLSRLRREAHLLSRLNHPNIATVHDFDTVDGISFLVMEFIKGETLDRKLAAGPMTESEILRLGVQLMDGLDTAHQEGIIHRDLKPGNLRETPDGRLKILDFGLARVVKSDLDSTQSTASAAIAGTLPYMAPEQLQGDTVDARTDIYSAGVVLYEFATGQRPFTDTLAPRLIDSILHRSVTPAREISPQISPGLDALILKAVEKDPSRRYGSAREMRSDLQRLQVTEATVRQSPDNPPAQSQAPPMEIAHVLFTDIVGYSKLPMDEQQKQLRRLQTIVRETREFSRARSQDQLISLPTGDGMALVFFGEPESAARCALELGEQLRRSPEINLRIGLNSGPVYRLADINANRNVAGGGINIAQRIMDCGDAGHILVSKSVADVLGELTIWQRNLHDLGEVEVKHGVRLHVFNLVTDVAGNPAVPAKVEMGGPRKNTTISLPRRWTWVALAVPLVSVLAVTVWIFRASLFGGKSFRPTVAVLGFKNESGTNESDWISDSLSEMLASGLAAGDEVVPTPGESVSRMKLDLDLPVQASYAPDSLKRVQGRLHCDYVIYGSFFDSGKSAGGRVQLNVTMERASSGVVLASMSESGTEIAIPELAAHVDAGLRSTLRLHAISISQSSELQAAVPSTPDARQKYFRGLGQLRNFDLLGARDSFTAAISADPNFSLAHAYLAEAWVGLGYDQKAKDEAKAGFDLSSLLGREDKTLVEARFREISTEWNEAIDLYRTLSHFYPENPEYAYSAADVQTRAGKATDALATIEELRKQPGPIGQDPRLDLEEAEADEALSDFPKERQAAQRAADGARSNGYRLLEAESLWRSCNAMAYLGDVPAAQAACQRSIELAQPVNDLVLVARVYTMLGRIATAQGNSSQALDRHRKALGFARAIGSRRDITGALLNIGTVLADQGNLPDAQKSFEESLAVSQEIDDKTQSVTLLNDLATLSQEAGGFSVALKLYQQSLDLARAIQDKGSSARALSNMGTIYSLQGNFQTAMDDINQAVQQADETGDKSNRALFLFALGNTYLDQGEIASAQRNFQAGLDLANQIGDKPAIAQGWLSTATFMFQQGDAQEAETLAHRAADEFHDEGMKDQESDARTLLASALLDLDRPDEASKQLDLIFALAPDGIETKLMVAITKARLQARSDKRSDTVKSLEAVSAQTQQLGIPAVQFEARLAQAEIGLFGGDKHAALALLTVLERDAAKKGFGEVRARAKRLSEQISSQGRG
jgi:serine/threonine protein kinase/tetratricopeptide (TPR) repeat protein/TolB-like protein